MIESRATDTNRHHGFIDDDEKRRRFLLESLSQEGASRVAVVHVHSLLDRYCAYQITRHLRVAVSQGYTDVILNLSNCPEVFYLGVAELTIRTRAQLLNTTLSYRPCGRDFDAIFDRFHWRKSFLPRPAHRAGHLSAGEGDPPASEEKSRRHAPKVLAAFGYDRVDDRAPSNSASDPNIVAANSILTGTSGLIRRAD